MLVDCAKKGYIDSVKCLVEHQDADVNYDGTVFAYSVLQIAAMNGNTEVVKYLVSKGADIKHIQVFLNDKPLYNAVRKGYVDTARTLIELGAKTELTNDKFLSNVIESADSNNY